MFRFSIAVIFAACLAVLPLVAQDFETSQETETPTYSDGDQLLVESLTQRLRSANEACQAQPEVQEYQQFSARVRAHIEEAYPGYTLGTDYSLVPVVEVTEPTEEAIESADPLQ
jgi:hypothetical protein